MNISTFLQIFLFVFITGLIVYVIIQRYLYLRTKVNEVIHEKVVLKILVPIKNDKKALAAEQLFQSLHGILKGDEKSKDHYSFEIQATSQREYFSLCYVLLDTEISLKTKYMRNILRHK